MQLYTYYSTQRPVGPGTCPMNGLLEVVNFECRRFVEEIGREAWGFINYIRKLEDSELSAYELVDPLRCYDRKKLEREAGMVLIGKMGYTSKEALQEVKQMDYDELVRTAKEAIQDSELDEAV